MPEIEPLRAPGGPPLEPWMETLSGDKYHYLKPSNAVINVNDIARALTYKCRYNGHLTRFYSVAEHCNWMTLWAAQNGYSPIVQYLCLMHDAHEAYVGDVPSPQKAAMIVIAKDHGHHDPHSLIEAWARDAVEQQFNLAHLWTPENRVLIKEFDTRICIDERESLKPKTPHEWGLDRFQSLGITDRIRDYDWRDFEETEALWLGLYQRLKLK